jgi:hypothetical protein
MANKDETLEVREAVAKGQKSKYLLYTSAGDRSNVHEWLSGERNFDLWITYYGDYPGALRSSADYYHARKGGKFPNLHYVYRTWPRTLESYSAIMVLDDDIVINAAQIADLFRIREEFGLWLLQPAFSPEGKISHAITKAQPNSFLRHVNFVESGCALFERSKLDQFMAVYDPVLVGWGIDWWYMEVLGPDLVGKVAVVDAIPCINPHHRPGGGSREIDLLQSTNERRAAWESIRNRYDIQSEARGYMEYSTLRDHPAPNPQGQ